MEKQFSVISFQLSGLDVALVSQFTGQKWLVALGITPLTTYASCPQIRTCAIDASGSFRSWIRHAELIHAPHTVIRRRYVEIVPEFDAPPNKTRFWLLARLCPAGLVTRRVPTKGFHMSHNMASPLPGVFWPNPNEAILQKKCKSQ